MGYIVTNVVAILVATCAGLAVGACFLLPRRALAVGRSGSTVGLVVTAALAEFWLASILAGALILAPSQAGAWTMALGSAVVIWIGFVLPVLVVTDRVRGVPVVDTVLATVHWLAAMVAEAAVLQAIGLVRPA